MKQIFSDQNAPIICERCDGDQFKVFDLNAVDVAICNRCGVRRTVEEWRKIKRKATIFRETERGLF